MIIINSQNEMEKYYNKEIDTYIFSESVEFNCDIDVESDIYVESNIVAQNIDEDLIHACNIYEEE